jgi:predicted secreted protein
LDSEGKLVYKKTAVYPKSLSELKLVQSEFGYFSGNINLTDFTYSTSTVSGQMTYELGVVLPNGQYYTSPFSNKHK